MKIQDRWLARHDVHVSPRELLDCLRVRTADWMAEQYYTSSMPMCWLWSRIRLVFPRHAQRPGRRT